jgi:hypothetical protein
MPETMVTSVPMRCLWSDGRTALLEAKDKRARVVITTDSNSPTSFIPGYLFQEGASVTASFEIEGRN